MQMKAGVPVNDDAGLESEADVMGAKALQLKKHNNPIQFIKNAGSAFHLSSQTVAQRAATKINYTTGNFTYTDTNGDEQEQEVGIGMTAHLNPAQAREGTSPGGMDDLMTALGDEYSHQRMIRGHLLNGNLGGLGIPENLFPITNRANRLHETQVENHVKKEIEDGNETDYRVTVINAAMTQDDPDATFHCEAWQADGTKIIDKEINSIPSANRRNSASVDDNQEDEMDNKAGGIRYRNVDLPQGWGERGSGRRGEIDYEHVTGNKYNLQDNTDNSLNATINK
ncbi:DNA/RNA non-specific endonuclease [Undibacterium sp. FT79W]|nr:DNA/RNA non-specific endonuclease [Undibacterium sp. FT79W]